jgi:hypothetical protein
MVAKEPQGHVLTLRKLNKTGPRDVGKSSYKAKLLTACSAV